MTSQNHEHTGALSSARPFDRVNTAPIFGYPDKHRGVTNMGAELTPPAEIEANLRAIAHDATYDKVFMYIHVPFCISFCHYCDFTRSKYPWKDKSQLARYTDYLLREIDYYLDLPYVKNREFSGIYVGGGSPSTLGGDLVARLWSHLQAKVPNYANIEKTFTGEPKTLKQDSVIEALVAHGINRVTFGIETTDNAIREAIGRTDTLTQIDAVFDRLAATGFRGDTCVDFMFHHVGQTCAAMEQDLAALVERWHPTEIDAYGTTYIPKQPLHVLVASGQRPPPADDADLLRMREFVYDYLTSNGYNNLISETYSRNSIRTRYQTAHCAREAALIPIGCSSRGNLGDCALLNPREVKTWMENIEARGVSAEVVEPIGRDGVFKRIMVMWPRYKTLEKSVLETYRDTPSFERFFEVFEQHRARGLVDDAGDSYELTKLGVMWHPNLQWDYMQLDFSEIGSRVLAHFTKPVRALVGTRSDAEADTLGWAKARTTASTGAEPRMPSKAKLPRQ